jgi:hypothetical protein
MTLAPMTPVGRTVTTIVVLLLLACGEAVPPPTVEIGVLSGSPYERGFQHGQQFSGKIQSLYATLLENSLMPFLNREQKDVAAFLEEYQKDLYAHGQFSYQMLLQSGQHLAAELAVTYPDYLEEMHGIADGAGMPFEKILILNTFVDTMLAFRSITFFIRQLQAPTLEQVEFIAALDGDGHDNNGDGQVDDGQDGLVRDYRVSSGFSDHYGPKPHAVMVEVPATAAIRLRFKDPPPLTSFTGDVDPDKRKEGEEQGIDPASIRIQLNDTVYDADSGVWTATVPEDDDTALEVLFTPPEPLPEAAVISLVVQAGNLSRIVDPPPIHARFMRDERIVFGTVGLGLSPAQIPNLGVADGRTQPPSLACAFSGSATASGNPLLAHHFALLDANVSHKHAVLLVHRPDDGTPHVTLGWAGLVWGFSGMNRYGLSLAVNLSDTLDNPLAGAVRSDIFNARLLSSGTPIGIAVREALAHRSDTDGARAFLETVKSTFGWNLLLADRHGALTAVEMDGDILGQENSFVAFSPADPTAPSQAHVGDDDLTIASHFQANIPDIDTTILIFAVRPQRYWSSFYYRSLRAHGLLRAAIAEGYGDLSVSSLFEILRTPGLVDQRDSMNAVVFEPRRKVLHYAMGQVPATDGAFVRFDLEAFLDSLEGP